MVGRATRSRVAPRQRLPTGDMRVSVRMRQVFPALQFEHTRNGLLSKPTARGEVRQFPARGIDPVCQVRVQDSPTGSTAVLSSLQADNELLLFSQERQGQVVQSTILRQTRRLQVLYQSEHQWWW